MPVSLKEIGPDVDWTDDVINALAMKATMQDTVKLSRIRPIGASEAAEIYRLALR